MQRHRIITLPTAERELDVIYNVYHKLVGARSAHRAMVKIKKRIVQLSYTPMMGREAYEDPALAAQGFRVLNCGSHLCFYKFVDNVVEIHHIVDGRTDYIPRVLGMK